MPSENQIILYEHADFSGKSHTIDLANFRPNTVHTLSGTPLQDNASAVRWNIQPNRVVTLSEHNSSPKLPDLSGLGRTFDLTGSGETHLGIADINDCISAFFWRDVDLSRGHIVFYKDGDYRNIRQTVFIAEWPPNTAINISNWAIQDRMSSVRWMNLDPRIVIGLYDGTVGGGSSYTNIKRRGTGSGYEGEPSLAAYGMQDKVSSFKIMELLPLYETINKIEFDLRNFPRKSVTMENKGSIQGTQSESSYTADVTTTWVEASSVTLEQSHRVGGAVSYEYSTGGGSTGAGKHTFSVTLSYDYTRTRSDTATKSEMLQISHKETYPIPPNHGFEFKLILRYDQLDTAFTTQATRWYAEPLLGTTADTTKSPGKTLYRRTEEVKGVLHGSFRYDTVSSFVTTPL